MVGSAIVKLISFVSTINSYTISEEDFYAQFKNQNENLFEKGIRDMEIKLTEFIHHHLDDSIIEQLD